MRMQHGRHNRWLLLVGAGLMGWLGGTAGCSDLVTPTGSYAVTHPWDAGPPVSRGTSKAEVLEKWGRPDEVIPRGADELGIPKEEWIYQAKTDVPLDYRYLSKTKRIFFSGDSVTGWQDEAGPDAPTHR